MNIYVGNLSFETTDADLNEAFAQFGRVDSARVIIDKYTDRPRGFGFVEMSDDAQARDAIAKMDGATLHGRTIKVNEARPREDRRPNRGPRTRY